MTCEFPIPSPCIGQCCLGADNVCLGCFRHLAELRLWRDLDTNAKKMILLRCKARRAARGNGEEAPEGVRPEVPLLGLRYQS